MSAGTIYRRGSRELERDLGATNWTAIELIEHDRLTGAVVRLPRPGTYHGNRLFLRLANDAVVGIPATAAKGHAVLEHSLREQCIGVGEYVAVQFTGWRKTKDGKRTYRLEKASRA